jgi:hypothetical protein
VCMGGEGWSIMCSMSSVLIENAFCHAADQSWHIRVWERALDCGRILLFPQTFLPRIFHCFLGSYADTDRGGAQCFTRRGRQYG